MSLSVLGISFLQKGLGGGVLCQGKSIEKRQSFSVSMGGGGFNLLDGNYDHSS